MPSEDTKILEFNQCQKSDKAQFVIYSGLEGLIEKIDGRRNNFENSSKTKVDEHFSSSFSLSAISFFKSIDNEHDVQRGKNCMKKFCESLREHAIKIINFKTKKNDVIKKRAAGVTWKCKNLLNLLEKIESIYVKDKKYCKVIDHCHYTGEYRGAAHSICNLKYSVPKKSPAAFYNGCNCDYHFIIKELAEEFEKQLLV